MIAFRSEKHAQCIGLKMKSMLLQVFEQIGNRFQKERFSKKS